MPECLSCDGLKGDFFELLELGHVLLYSADCDRSEFHEGELVQFVFVEHLGMLFEELGGELLGLLSVDQMR